MTIAMLLLLYVLIATEILWDGYHEVVLKQSPNYVGSNLLRFIVGVCYWMAFPFLASGVAVMQWFWIPAVMVSNFWFFFDWGLNWFRQISGIPRKYYYLGDNNPVDRFQNDFGGAKQWFYIKAFLAAGSLVIFFVLAES